MYKYDSRGKRDPFVPLVGATSSKSVHSIEDIISIEDVDLQGVASDSRGRTSAIINGEMIKVGQTIGRLTLKSISSTKIHLSIDEVPYSISIYEEER